MKDKTIKGWMLASKISAVVYIMGSIMIYKFAHEVLGLIICGDIWDRSIELPRHIPMGTDIKVNIFLLIMLFFGCLSIEDNRKKMGIKSIATIIIVTGIIFILNQLVADPLHRMDNISNNATYGTYVLGNLWELHRIVRLLNVFSISSFISLMVSLSIWYGYEKATFNINKS